VFADPPYGSRMLDRVLDDWRARRFSPLIVVEHALSHDLPRPDQRLVFDETVVAIYRR
jgi:16S rRNA (guanine966-N2)-methyltransferase